MHAVFYPYGKKEWVDILLRDMMATKLPHRFYKEGESDVFMVAECQIRVLPLGFYEFIFPKEYQDIVLTTLNFHRKDKGHSDFEFDKEFSFGPIKIKPMEYLKKWLRIEDPKDFKLSTEIMNWLIIHVSIIPIGVRYEQGTIVEKQGQFQGWSHEAI